MRFLWSPNEIINAKAIRILRDVVFIVSESLYNISKCLFRFAMTTLSGKSWICYQYVSLSWLDVSMQSTTGCCRRAVPRHYKSTTACLCPLASTLFSATFLTINWIKTQDHIYQCSAQMKLRIRNIRNKKIDRKKHKKISWDKEMKWNQDKCKVLCLGSQN